MTGEEGEGNPCVYYRITEDEVLNNSDKTNSAVIFFLIGFSVHFCLPFTINGGGWQGTRL